MATLLISIDRRKSFEEAEENVNLALEFQTEYPEIVVGIDFSGDARVNRFEDFFPILSKAQNQGLKISLHFAEENEESEMEFVLSHFKPNRFGHCTFVYPNFWQKFSDLNIPAELCLTSNVKCGSVKSYQDHHVKHFSVSKLKIVLCYEKPKMAVILSCSSLR